MMGDEARGRSHEAAFGQIQATTLADVLREHARSRPQDLAAICHDARLTYAQLDERVDRLSAALLARGVNAGDRVLWIGQNCHRLYETILACARLGAIACPANWRLSASELQPVVEDGACAVVLWQAQDVGDTAAELRDRTRSSAFWIQHDGRGPEGYEALIESAVGRAPEVGVDPGLPVLQLYTAGGQSAKGALLTHFGILVHSLVIALQQRLDAEYVYLNCGPMFHVASLWTFFATYVVGGCNVFIPRADPEAICEAVHRERCNGAFLATPTIERIVALNSDGRYDLTSLRTRVWGRPEAWAAMTTPDESPWGSGPTGYGQTEVSGVLTLAALGGAGGHGRPAPLAQVRVVDEEGNDVQPGGVGEIVARGPTIMLGYWGRPAVNEERFRDGWYHTNDLARRELDGSLTFVGPRGRMIKSGVENIIPAEIERCIEDHPDVAAAAAIGVPDETWGQSVKVIVVLREGASLSRDDIVAWCQSRIASYKKPRFVEFADELPRSATGIDYQALDARYGGGGYPGSELYRKLAKA